MRCTLALLAAAAAFVSAVSAGTLVRRQDLTYPSCANSCLLNANTGSCGAGDITCECKDQQFVTSTAACIAQACSGSDLAQANEAAVQSCLAVGVNISSDSAAASSTSAPAASSSSGASAASSTSASTSPTSPSAASSSSSSSAAPTTSNTSGASVNGVNTFVGFAAVGLAAFVF